MTPSQKKAIDELREAGYAIAVFAPEEMKGALPEGMESDCQKAVEAQMHMTGNETLEVLAYLAKTKASSNQSSN